MASQLRWNAMTSRTLADPDATLSRTGELFREWLADRRDVLEPFRHEVAEELEQSSARFRPLQQLLWDDGWHRLGWPTEAGGLGGSPLHRFVVAEELAAAGYVNPAIHGSVEIIAPMLLRFAPTLAARHLPRGVRGDEVWCQGFSEPDAGSDLGSLRTRAVADGDGFRISGQKMWSSNGHLASWCCLLARTGDTGDGYRGLTMFWVDLAAEGVRVVPTKLESGVSDTSEIFLDHVYVPRSHLIGDVGQGWAVVMYLMQFERGAYAWGRQADLLTQLTDLLAEAGARQNDTDDTLDVVGDAYLALFGLRARCRDTIASLAGGQDLGPQFSIDKILLSAAEQTMTECARRLLHPRLELAGSDDALAELWRSRWSFSRITTIYGGAGEVQRDLVAERLLGLPRGR
jgi:alkylation response protein AidB-like acyl-CoA dehydrogenase